MLALKIEKVLGKLNEYKDHRPFSTMISRTPSQCRWALGMLNSDISDGEKYRIAKWCIRKQKKNYSDIKKRLNLTMLTPEDLQTIDNTVYEDRNVPV